MFKSRFIIVEHHAIKARLHFDLRFQLENSDNWESFAVRKGVPLEVGEKVLAVKTRIHSTEEALFLGKIESGYGAGVLKKWDDGPCIVHSMKPGHILIEFKGHKVKGFYHMISVGVMNRKMYKSQQYMLFKGKTLNEMTGMMSKLWGDDVEEGQAEEVGMKLPWSNT